MLQDSDFILAATCLSDTIVLAYFDYVAIFVWYVIVPYSNYGAKIQSVRELIILYMAIKTSNVAESYGLTTDDRFAIRISSAVPV